MPKYDTVIKPVGGLIDTNMDPSIVSKQYSPNMKNMFKYGDYFGQRPGRTVYGNGLGAVMLYYHFKIGDYNKFIKFTKQRIYTRSSSGWTNVTGSDLSGDLDNFIDACTVYDETTGTPYVVFTNGTNNIRKYTGTGNTSDMSGWTGYKARFVRYYQGYLLALHLTASGTRNGFQFRCSDTGYPNDTTGTNSQTFNMTKDKKISDIMKAEYFGDYLAIYKTDCIYLLWLGNTANLFEFDVAVHQTGLRASNAVAIYKDGSHFFLGYDDFYYWPSANAKPVGLTNKKIRKMLFDNTEPGKVARSFAIYDQRYDKVRLYVPESQYLNKVYVLDCADEEWTWWDEEVNDVTAVGSYLPSTIVTIDELTGIYGSIDGMAGTQIDQLSGFMTDNYPLLIEGDKAGNSKYEDETKYNDDGDTIDSYIETGDFIFITGDVPFSSDRIMGVKFEAKGLQASGDRLYVYYSVDEGSTWTEITAGLNLADFSVWTDYISLGSSWAFYEAHCDVQCRKIRFKIANPDNSSTFMARKLSSINEDGDPE